MKFVAFLDVLGFKEMVEACTHEKLERVYGNLLTNVSMALSGGKFVTNESPSGQHLTADLTAPLSSSIIVSDSVIFWTDDTSMKSFIGICAATRNLLVSGIYTGLPMRGGIAMGELSHLKSNQNTPSAFGIQTVFGRGLVRAFLEESKYDWMGCVISDECVAEYESACAPHVGHTQDLATLDGLVKAGLLIRYRAPRKCGASIPQWVVNWPQGNRGSVSVDTVTSSFTMHNKSLKHESATKKLSHTLQFLKASTLAATSGVR